jgi:hypothetical protein
MVGRAAAGGGGGGLILGDRQGQGQGACWDKTTGTWYVKKSPILLGIGHGVCVCYFVGLVTAGLFFHV